MGTLSSIPVQFYHNINQLTSLLHFELAAKDKWLTGIFFSESYLGSMKKKIVLSKFKAKC